MSDSEKKTRNEFLAKVFVVALSFGCGGALLIGGLQIAIGPESNVFGIIVALFLGGGIGGGLLYTGWKIMGE